MDTGAPRPRWYQVVSQALLDAAAQYQLCRRRDAATEAPYPAGGAATS
ncbi:MAG: hypothetical protein ACRD0N_15605 [Acidimicrobiales bacterium]